MATTKIVISGPLLTAVPPPPLPPSPHIAGEVAEVGRDWIKLDTQRMTRSGSDTGQAAEGVELSATNGAYIIRGGIHEGKYSWPWLEGTSQRNQSTPFKGYHTFRRTRLRMRKQVLPLAEKRLEEYLERMGGTEK